MTAEKLFTHIATIFFTMKIKAKFHPSHKNGRPTFKRKAFSRAGVYLIREKAGLFTPAKIIYVGMSMNNLYRTIYRHFQDWNDKRQQRYTYNKNTHEIAVLLLQPAKVQLMEDRLIYFLRPRDNKQKIESLFSEKQAAAVIEKQVEEAAQYTGRVISDDEPF